MWSIRMRASKAISYQQSAVSNKRMAHISGAEGMYEEKEAERICREYIERALTHPRGRPDEIHITIEKIRERPQKVALLPVATLKCNSPDDSEKLIKKRLSDIGISQKAISNAFKILESKKTMRGASLMSMELGRRAEPDRERGVRVSRMGIEKSAEKKLTRILSMMKINTTTVKEALILASKAAFNKDIIAEACISDDPDYTTGYIASDKFGYLRIPNIKRKGEMHGGRIFFVRENSDIEGLINYLEKMPVISKL